MEEKMNEEVEEAKRVIRVAFANDTQLRRKYVARIWASLGSRGIPGDMVCMPSDDRSALAVKILDEIFYDDDLPPK